MRCYRRFLNISYKDHVTNEEVRNRIQNAIGLHDDLLLSSHLSPLTSEVLGAPQMTLQQYLSTLPCLPLSSGNLQTPFPSIPWCYLPIFYSVFPSCSFHCPLQNCLRHARGSWDVAIPSEFQMKGEEDRKDGKITSRNGQEWSLENPWRQWKTGFWFDFCFTALQHILGHFRHGQLT